jgi:hypothetical protein
MNLRSSLQVFKRQWSVSFRVVPLRTELLYGVGNRCTDGRFILFLDYDGDIGLEWVQDEIKLLQEQFGLGNCYIFKSKNGFHVVNFEKRSISEIVEIMRWTTCDQQYKDTPLLFAKKVWVLRLSRKNKEIPAYVGVIQNATRYPVTASRAHFEYMTDFYRVPKKDLRGVKLDRERGLYVAQYPVPKGQL